MALSRKQLSTKLRERLYIASRLVIWSRPGHALGPVRPLGQEVPPSKRPESPVAANQKISTALSSIVHRLLTTACHRRPVFLNTNGTDPGRPTQVSTVIVKCESIHYFHTAFGIIQRCQIRFPWPGKQAVYVCARTVRLLASALCNAMFHMTPWVIHQLYIRRFSL